MIRRITHIALAALLFLMTTGFTVHQHFCWGNLIESNIFHAPESCCGDGCDCCSDDQESFQLKTDFVDFIQLIEFSDFVIDLPVLEPLFTNFIQVRSVPLNHSKIFRPPDRSTVLARLQVFCL